jgi:hypothetical protein
MGSVWTFSIRAIVRSDWFVLGNGNDRANRSHARFLRNARPLAYLDPHRTASLRRRREYRARNQSWAISDPEVAGE